MYKLVLLLVRIINDKFCYFIVFYSFFKWNTCKLACLDFGGQSSAINSHVLRENFRCCAKLGTIGNPRAKTSPNL